MQKVKFGKHRQRRSYARISEVIDLPDLIEIQTLSYDKFLETGLKDVFKDVSPIEGNNDKLSLEFIDYKLGTPKYNVDESKERDATYSAPLRVRVRLINKERDEIKEQEVFMGELPMITKTGSFIINGAEHVNVSQDEALRMATSYPAKAVSVDDRYGYIKEGYIADLTYFDKDYKVKGTVAKGNLTEY